MAAQRHQLEIYEPYDYTGPNPLAVAGLGMVPGPAGSSYYLVAPETPFSVNSQPVVQLLIQCRYREDKHDRPSISACTVNIARVVPGANLTPGQAFPFDHIARWGVGKITPMPDAD